MPQIPARISEVDFKKVTEHIWQDHERYVSCRQICRKFYEGQLLATRYQPLLKEILEESMQRYVKAIRVFAGNDNVIIVKIDIKPAVPIELCKDCFVPICHA